MKLSVVMPAHNEEGSVGGTVTGVVEALDGAGIEHEVVVVSDASTDRTEEIVEEIATRHPQVRVIRSPNPPGFGLAIRAGLDAFTGDAVAIVMADGSENPNDLVAYQGLLEAGYECAFGSRWMPGAHVYDYPRFKLVINRIVNFGIRVLFRHGYNDTTNAFKAYRRDVVENLQPLLSNHFNLTVEMPLKAITRGYRFGVVPTSWSNRSVGESHLALQEMGSRYLFIVLYVFLEQHLSRGDYRRKALPR